MTIFVIIEVERTYADDGEVTTVERLALPDVYLATYDDAESVVHTLNNMAAATSSEVDYHNGEVTYSALRYERFYVVRGLVPMPEDYTL